MIWFYADEGRQVGPVEEAALDELVQKGVVRDETLVWHEGMANWQPHAAVRGAKLPAPMPSVMPVTGDTAFCSECGRPFPANQLVGIGGASVCAQCKPVYLQRIREGGKAIGARHYGGFWIRFVARLIDGIIMICVSLLINLPVGLVLGLGSVAVGGRPGASLGMLMGAQGVLTLINLALGVAYEVYFLSTRGATPGKMVLGLKVIRSDGGPISAGVAVGRYFAQWISAIILMIGYIMAGFDPEKRALHDRICDTRVIYTK